MAATGLDLPVLISAEQIRRREFVTTRRGYDPDQVRHYLEQLADQVDEMASMIREARLEAEAAIRTNAQPRVDPYERLAKRMASVIREADEAAERFRVEGRREAERMLIEARADADRIRTDAQAKAEEARLRAEEALHGAREQADRTLAGLSGRREALVGQLAQMQERLLEAARGLESAIEMPSDQAPPQRPEAAAPASTREEPPTRTRKVVELRRGGETRAIPSPAADVPVEDLFGPADPSYAGLWDGTDTIAIEMPEIPPLDLSWGDDGDETKA